MTDRPLVAQAVVFRLYPNEAQAAQMRQWIGAARALWNHLLGCQKRSLDETKKLPTHRENEQERQRWEKEPDCLWRTAAQSHARQQVVRDLERAWRDFFASRKGKRAGPKLMPPRFKKKLPGGAFYVANERLKLASGLRQVKLDKLGEMRLRGGREIAGRILGARVRHCAGHWYLTVQFEGPPPRDYGQPSEACIGVDVGLKAAVARSDGIITEAPRFFRKAEKRLRRLQRRVSASQRGSHRARRKARAVARLQEKVANKRRDFLHVRSARIVGKAAVVAIETLNIKGMARSRLAKSVADAGMGELHRQIVYKAGWYGRQVVKADRFEPSSKTCSGCGQLHEMPLHRRTMRCECGLEIDRDLNAALNLRRIGLAQVGAVSAEPAPQEPTRGETGCQEQAARPSAPVLVVEPRSVKAARPRRTRGRAPDISACAGNTSSNRGSVGGKSIGPLFEWLQ